MPHLHNWPPAGKEEAKAELVQAGHCSCDKGAARFPLQGAWAGVGGLRVERRGRVRKAQVKRRGRVRQAQVPVYMTPAPSGASDVSKTQVGSFPPA